MTHTETTSKPSNNPADFSGFLGKGGTGDKFPAGHSDLSRYGTKSE